MTPKRLQKIYELKSAELAENTIAGVASVMGVMDRGRDVIYPGAFSKRGLLKSFIENGFIAVGHDWEGLPVAMPTKAKEVGNELLTEAVFHSTTAAQEARTVAMERLANGKSVGLSIGFLPDYEDGVNWFDTGKDLLAHAESMGCDMSLFDTRGISACKSFCRGLSGIAELFEYSIVCVPMNQRAQATDVKSYEQLIESIQTERQFEAFLRDAGFSRKQATVITLHGFKGLQRDADESGEPNSSTEEPTPDSAEIEAKTPPIEAPPAEELPPALDAEAKAARERRFAELTRKTALLHVLSPV